MRNIDFHDAFQALTQNPPFPWQAELFRCFVNGKLPSSCNLPTGLGKTAVIPIWLISLATTDGRQSVPRRLVYVVNRRTVVDQATEEAKRIRDRLTAENRPAVLTELAGALAELAAKPENGPLAISTLRGQFADNREWSADPCRPAVIVGTVDMIGSRLLFSGYGCGFKSRPLHAGFLGQDVLLVHDEAHLEPAFQKLITDLEREQRSGRTRDFRPLRVMELTATSRAGGPTTFGLEDADYQDATVRDRIFAKKGIAFHEAGAGAQPGEDAATADKKKPKKDAVAAKIADLALEYRNSQQAILVFVRTLDDVETVAKKLKAGGAKFELLTGTMRGKERDALVQQPIFQRFRPGEHPQPKDETVYLVCTSAGEVGIDISADQLVCDLTPFESMAQRFGRVNRRGGEDKRAHIDIVHEAKIEGTTEYDQRRMRTLELLHELPTCDWDTGRRDASPHALGELPNDRRQAAFSPQPIILPTSDILFDAWALTTIREPLPGRPRVAEYLHGVEDDKMAETSIAWREEVWVLRGFADADRPKQFEQFATDLLDDYPLKPHEVLRDSTFRKSTGVRDKLAKLAERHGELPVWIQEPNGDVIVMSLGKVPERPLAGRTVLLPPEAGGLQIAQGRSAGLFDVEEEFQPEHRHLYDVADEWRDENGNRRRVRLWDQPVPNDVGRVRLVRRIDTRPETEDEEGGEETDGRRFWNWFVRVRSAEEGAGSSAAEEQRLEPHLERTGQVALTFALKLLTDPGLRTAVGLAARWHDLGKHRGLWQRNMGNGEYPAKVIAKTGHNKPPKEWIDYRHEFGSLLDVRDEKHAFRQEFEAETEEVRELILHLIAAHHGRGRPHFPADEVFDPEPKGINVSKIAAEVPRRFARLQQKYGRWGLAWLESLVRAADAEASARPSDGVEKRQ